MKKTPFVSVLVPVFNTEAYLKRCLDSLIGQRLKNVEIVCVDDGSTDGSGRILDEYASRDARIRVIHKENGGLPSARNAGLDVARGEYVGFVDSDDFVKPETFSTLYRAAKRKRADIVVCGAVPFPDPPAPDKWLVDVLSPRDKTYDGFSPDVLFGERGARPFLWRDLVRRDLVERHGLRLEEDVVVGEDQAFQFKFFPRAGRVAFLSDKLYYYRHAREGSIMAEARLRPDERVFQHIRLVRSAFSSLREAEKLSACASDAFAWGVRFLYADLFKLSLPKRKRAADALLSLYGEFGFAQRSNVLGADVREELRYIRACRAANADQPFLTVVADATDDALLAPFFRSLRASEERNYEVILTVRGGGREKAGAAYAYAAQDLRVRVVPFHAGTPRHVAFNECMRLAASECMLFLPRPTVLTDPAFFSKALSAFLVGADVFYCGKGFPSLFSFAILRSFCVGKGLVFDDFFHMGEARFLLTALYKGKAIPTEKEAFFERKETVFAPSAQTAEGAAEAFAAAKRLGVPEYRRAVETAVYGDAFAAAMRALPEQERVRAWNALVGLSAEIDAIGDNVTGDALLPVCRDVFPAR